MFYHSLHFSRPLARRAKIIIPLLFLLCNTHIQPLEAKDGARHQDCFGKSTHSYYMTCITLLHLVSLCGVNHVSSIKMICWANCTGYHLSTKLGMLFEGVLPKDAWPELLFHDRFEVAHTIHDPINRHSDTNIRIFAQYPYEEDHRKAPDFDKDTDYWLYITNNDIVYEIPKPGRWHPNRTISTLSLLSWFILNAQVNRSNITFHLFKDDIWVYRYANNQESNNSTSQACIGTFKWYYT